jgi:sugar phosphate isomerase/epimerase
MMNRREFLGTVASATLAGHYWACSSQTRTIDPIGVQLYTVRDDMRLDFEGSLAKIAGIGYKEVELAGFAQDPNRDVTYWSKSPREVRDALDRHGLVSPSTHVSLRGLEPDNLPRVIEASRVIGNRYIVMPWIDEADRRQPDIWERTAEVFNRAGETCSQAGMQFAYHNHWFEFLPVNGEMPYDVLLNRCDAELVKMQLDLCWIRVAGSDPVDYFKRYPGRFPLVHVKDIKKFPEVTEGGSQNFGDTLEDMTEVGSGIIDWNRIFSHSDTAGIQHYIVEHDRPARPFESVTLSYEFLKNLRY